MISVVSKNNKGISNDKSDNKNTTSWSNKKQQDRRIEEWENWAEKDIKDEDDDEVEEKPDDPKPQRKRLLGEKSGRPQRNIGKGIIETAADIGLGALKDEIIERGTIDVEDIDEINRDIKAKIQGFSNDMKSLNPHWEEFKKPEVSMNNSELSSLDAAISWAESMSASGKNIWWTVAQSGQVSTSEFNYKYWKNIENRSYGMTMSYGSGFNSGSSNVVIEDRDFVSYSKHNTCNSTWNSFGSGSYIAPETYSMGKFSNEELDYEFTTPPYIASDNYRIEINYPSVRHISGLAGYLRSLKNEIKFDPSATDFVRNNNFNFAYVSDDGKYFSFTFSSASLSSSGNKNILLFEINSEGEIITYPIPPYLEGEENMDNSCCQMISEIHAVISPADYPVKTPKNFGENKDEQIEISTLSQYLTYWMLRVNEAQGSFPQEIKITDTDLLQEGNQSETIKFESLSDAIMEIYGLLIKLIISQPVDQELMLRGNLITALTRDTVVKNNVLLDGIVEYLGFKTREKTLNIQSPIDIEGEGFDKILQNSERRVLVEENNDDVTLQMTLRNIEQAVAIIRAVHWRQLNPNGDIRGQILADIKSTAKDMIGGSSDDGIERFNEKNKGEATLEKAT